MSKYWNRQQFIHNLKIRYGRSYWNLPAKIRGELRFSDKICDLPDASCWYRGGKVSVDSNRITGDNPLLGEAYVAKALFSAVGACTLRGPNATPCFQSGEILTTPYRDTPQLIHEDVTTLNSTEKPIAIDFPSEDQCVISMIGRLDSNFYHWVTEYLPLLDVFMNYCNETTQQPIILLREHAPSFHVQSIKLFCPDIKIIHYVPNTMIPRLFVSTVPTAGFACHPVVTRLRKHAISQTNTVASSKKIYLYRPVGSWRYVKNHDEVIDGAIKFGFDPVNPSDLSLKDQIGLFSQATDIVSIHGSALTNVLFANDCNVVEFHGSYHDSVFSSLSNLTTNKHAKVRVPDESGNVRLSKEDIRHIFTLR